MKIDQLDEELLRLLSDRGRVVQAIGAIKRKNGDSIFVPGREHNLLETLRRKNKGPFPPQALSDIFQEIMNACRNLEKKLRVAYFGPEATFTHQAAIKKFGRNARYEAGRTIADVFADVEKGRADYGVVPIENSTEGVVNHTLDMFVESELSICAELEMPIAHYLLSKMKDAGNIRIIFSFPQPFAQCRRWVDARLPGAEVREASSTADAARLASRTKHSAAIASKLAADLYGLNIVASRIEDASANFTRFLIIGRSEPQATGRDKTSIMFSVKDRVGALYDMLVPFKKYHLNLTKIESRPTRQRPWEYVFFVDFAGHRSEPRVKRALEQLEKSCVFLKILGSYPRTE